ncbi:uncharacterized protein METZ01_LOCUS452779, partial [marine metagenome]
MGYLIALEKNRKTRSQHTSPIKHYATQSSISHTFLGNDILLPNKIVIPIYNP